MDAKIAQKRQTGSSARMTVLCGVTACVVCGIFLLFNYFLVNQRVSMLEERLDSAEAWKAKYYHFITDERP